MSKENPNEFKIINKNERLKYRQTINELKQQLEEKDKEIEEKMMSFEKRCQEYYKSDEFKRDFAVQELEKVAKNILDTFDINYEHWEFNHKCLYKHKQLEYYDIIEMIDNQIKELKGE